MSPTPITVSELNRRARACLEAEFPLFWVVGEISNLTQATSGHVYFNLKDASAQVRCVMFRNRVQLLPWRLANGQQVEVNARVSLYEARGDFQLAVEGMRRGGLGQLYERFSRLRSQLENEGLFTSERKRPIPPFPRTIGIITSAKAAALHDVLAALARRAPHIAVIIFPTPVQGADAAGAISTAIVQANKRGPCDLLLLVRGGGSIEDLWAFNEEVVARAIAASALPVIAGIGHESDITIADMVADQRAATPTAAAELATTHWLAAKTDLARLAQRLASAMQRRLDQLQQYLDLTSARLLHPAARLTQSKGRLHLLQHRLDSQMRRHITTARHQLDHARIALLHGQPDIRSRLNRLEQLQHALRHSMATLIAREESRLTQAAQALAHLDPAQTLARGYAIVRTDSGAIALAPADIPPEASFTVQLAHGDIAAKRLKTRT